MAVLVVALTHGGADALSAAPGRPVHQRPVAGEVVRAFTPPPTYGAGHRGVDLAAPPGTDVRSSAGGTVSHAGPVAGDTWVSVRHAGGVVTSYGPLAAVRVTPGERVEGRDVLGVVAAGGNGAHVGGSGLHWGARREGDYVDPLTLLGPGQPRPSLDGAGSWRGSGHVVTPYEPWEGGQLAGWFVAGSPDASHAGYARPPNPNHLVVVPGLATRSTTSLLDPVHLGYDPASVTAFSYAGRHDDGGAVDDPRRDQLPYGPEDTWAGVDAAARELATQLRAQAAREPGRPVDLLAHSMGGVAVLAYLTDHHDPYDPTLPQIGKVVTVGAPLRGSDLASVGDDLVGHSIVGPLLDLARRGLLASDVPFAGHLEALPLTAPAIEQLSVGSPRMDELALDWDAALGDAAAGPLATGTQLLTIAGAADPVVVADRARVPDEPLLEGVVGATPEEVGLVPARSQGVDAPLTAAQVAHHRVLPGGHHGVLATEALRQVAWEFLADREVVASPGRLSTIVGRETADLVRTSTGLLGVHDLVGAPLRALRRGVSPPRLPIDEELGWEGTAERCAQPMCP